MDGFSKKSSLLLGKISTLSFLVLVFQCLLCWMWWNLQNLQPLQWWFRRPVHDFWTDTPAQRAPSPPVRLSMVSPCPVLAEAAGSSQGPCSELGCPHGSFNCCPADRNWHGWISQPTKQKAKFTNAVFPFRNITFFFSGVNPHYENEYYETVSFEIGTVPQLGLSSGRYFNR